VVVRDLHLRDVVRWVHPSFEHRRTLEMAVKRPDDGS
jgi:hypothetical protein